MGSSAATLISPGDCRISGGRSLNCEGGEGRGVGSLGGGETSLQVYRLVGPPWQSASPSREGTSDLSECR